MSLFFGLALFSTAPTLADHWRLAPPACLAWGPGQDQLTQFGDAVRLGKGGVEVLFQQLRCLLIHRHPPVFESPRSA